MLAYAAPPKKEEHPTNPYLDTHIFHYETYLLSSKHLVHQIITCLIVLIKWLNNYFDCQTMKDIVIEQELEFLRELKHFCYTR